MPQTNLGRVAFKFQGDYSALTTYAKYDVVFDGYSSFVSIVDSNIGNQLSNNTYWSYLSKGQQIYSGTTAERLITPAIGTQYFDTTINKPIWYNGSAWVDATGTPA